MRACFKSGDFDFRRGRFSKKPGAYTLVCEDFFENLTKYKGKSTLLKQALRFFLASLFVLYNLSARIGLASEVFTLPTPRIETLANGLQIIWFFDERIPMIDLVLLVKSGFRDDPVSKAGTSELMASCLDRGIDGMTAHEIARSIERLGANRYAAGDDDTITVGMHGLSLDSEKLLTLLSKMILKPDFPDDEVKKEKSRVLERWDHLSDYVESVASVAFKRLLTAGTHYGRSNFVTKKELESIQRADLVAYWKTHFTPKNSVLMVVGQVNHDLFLKKIENLFSSWSGEKPPREWKEHADPRLKMPPSSILIVNRPGANQAQLRIGFKSPLFQAPEHFSLTVVNSFFGEYFNSRLNSLIRDKLGLTYSISSGFSYYKDLAHFSISSSTKNENIGQLLKKTVDVLNGLKSDPITKEEVQTAKSYLVGGFPLSVSTLGAIASRWLSGHIFDVGPNYLNEFVTKIEGVTLEQATSAATKYLVIEPLTIVISGDALEIEKSLKNAKYTKFKKINVSDLL